MAKYGARDKLGMTHKKKNMAHDRPAHVVMWLITYPLDRAEQAASKK